MRLPALADRWWRWMPRPANCCGSTASMKVARAAAAARQLSGRGLSYWTDGKGDDRILYVTPGYRLVCLDAKTGTPIKSFGADGLVDMKTFAVYGTGQPIDLVEGEIGLHSTPAVTRSGIVIVGSSFREGNAPKTHNNTKGLVLAFDVHTGKKLWQFNTIPRPGEFGNDTWLQESWATNGNTGVWTQIAVDEQLGLVYLPVETPSSDYYGGQRPGNNLFAETLVCVDLKTGKRKWHFQLVHHPIWDYDISSAPMLADLNVDGKRDQGRDSAHQAVLVICVRPRNRASRCGRSRSAPVPKGDVPGEWYSPTQPFPDQAAGLFAPGRLAGRSDRLHAGAAGGGRKVGFAIQAGSRCTRRRPKAKSVDRWRPWCCPRRPAGRTGQARRTIPRRTSFTRMRRRPSRRSVWFVRPIRNSTDMDFVMGRAGQTFRPSGGERRARARVRIVVVARAPRSPAASAEAAEAEDSDSVSAGCHC